MHNYRIITIISQSAASTLKLLQVFSESGVFGGKCHRYNLSQGTINNHGNTEIMEAMTFDKFVCQNFKEHEITL